MRRVLLAVGALVALLFAVMLVRAGAMPSRQPPALPLSPVEPLEGHVERLAAALRIPTVSSQSAPPDAAAFAALHAHLAASYPRVHAALTREVVGGHSLLYTWPGADATAKPILLLAHQDVVPVEPGTESRWKHPPFDGVVDGDLVWGRGARDDKSSLIAILEAVEALLAEGFAPARTVHLAFGHDEEVGGRGALAIVELLKSRGVRAELALDEGGIVGHGLIPGVDRPVALIGISEKGYASVELVAEADGGHSSMPPRSTAAGRIAEAVRRLEANPFPLRFTAASRGTLEFLGPEMSLGQRLAVGNLWLVGGAARKMMAQTLPGNAVLRTTTAVTMLEGSAKENVLPIRARAVVNFRLLPGDTAETVVAHVKDAVRDESIAVRALPGIASDPGPESRIDSPAFARIAGCARAAFPDALVAPTLVIGATDGRHYVAVADDVYRFSPMRAGPDAVKTVHGTDERLSVETFREGIRFYVTFITESTKK